MRRALDALLALFHKHGGGFCHLANGTQSRLISWSPEKPDKEKKAFLASHPDLTVRFVKDASVNKSELIADVDFIAFGTQCTRTYCPTAMGWSTAIIWRRADKTKYFVRELQFGRTTRIHSFVFL